MEPSKEGRSTIGNRPAFDSADAQHGRKTSRVADTLIRPNDRAASGGKGIHLRRDARFQFARRHRCILRLLPRVVAGGDLLADAIDSLAVGLAALQFGGRKRLMRQTATAADIHFEPTNQFGKEGKF
ncbi:hypothetical protein EET67_23960 [Pseudaminobacter arsenicus]|uniref:Uncharacterized protein n=1 Tax=Borborobacter arsenicus TaxID=1851146 RepID=A0A432UZF7_9HYPH|nr:hypothetical protein [Pseudaminobacter arsenicus]RUM95334.1 hypothetical protein EET67_23960 [Pseudaminobacter arsenicus]